MRKNNKGNWYFDDNVTFDDYYICTDAVFDNTFYKNKEEKEKIIKKLNEDFEKIKSPRSLTSWYWLDKENGYVYRESDHWWKVGRCNWGLKKDLPDYVYQRMRFLPFVLGRCHINDFKRNKSAKYNEFYKPSNQNLSIKNSTFGILMF